MGVYRFTIHDEYRTSEDPEGEYVHYSDYKKLEDENAALKLALTNYTKAGSGVLDAHGVEIREGDVLLYRTYKHLVEFKRRKHSDHGHGCGTDYITVGFEFDNYCGPIDKYSIIGNIHDTPDLMDKGE